MAAARPTRPPTCYFEYFTVLGLTLFGNTKENAFVYSLPVHTFQFVSVVIVGILFALRGGLWSQVETKQAQVLTSFSS